MTVGSNYVDQDARDAIAGHPIGGGQAYLDTLSSSEQITETDADVTVSTASGLISEIESGGQTIWVADGSTIDMTGQDARAPDASSVTIAGNHGQGGADGPLIYSDSSGTNSTAYRGGDAQGMIELCGVSRVTGVRLRGWAYDNWPNDEYPGFIDNYDDRSPYHARALTLNRHSTNVSSSLEVDNCELWGWATMAIYVGEDNGVGGVRAEVHHCDLHDNMLTGFGYHVDIKRGRAHVHHNYLNAHRHAVDVFGFPQSSYTAEYNLCGPATSDHVFDAHRIGQNLCGATEPCGSTSSDPDDDNYNWLAGSDLTIRYNTVLSETTIDAGSIKNDIHEPTVQLSGIPRPYDGTGCAFDRNEIAQTGPIENGPRTGGSPFVQTETREEDGFSINTAGYTSNIHIGDNLDDMANTAYDPDYGAGVNVDDPQSSPDRDYDRHVEIRDAITNEPIEGADVYLYEQ